MKKGLNAFDGFLLLDKPLGDSSNRALQQIKRLLSAQKAGHTGSLDPLATGLLPICLGAATKYAQFLLDAEKQYEFTVQLGSQTTTGDAEGDVIQTAPIPENWQAWVEEALASFLGKTLQIPSMFSAIKYQGKPLYEYARAGIEIERAPREIEVYAFTAISMTDDTLTAHIHCSKGTYVRNVAEDLAKKLGTVGYLKALRRTHVGDFKASQMVTYETLEATFNEKGLPGIMPFIQPISSGLSHLPALKFNALASQCLKQGRWVHGEGFSEELSGSHIRLYTQHDEFLGIALVEASGKIVPVRMQ